MSTRRHEEIFEECLSAYLEGRRSIEESLSLYPSHASELEPLLRAATRINETLKAHSPLPHVQERGLQRFLSDARARRNLASLSLGVKEPRRLSGIWRQYRLGIAGAAVAILVAGASIGGTALLSEGSDNDLAFNNRSEQPATPAAVQNFQAALQRVKELGTEVQASDIVRLRMATQDLQDVPSEEIIPVLDVVTQQLAEADDVVMTIASSNPDVAPEAEAASSVIRTVAGALASPAPAVTGPAETASADPTAAATADANGSPGPTTTSGATPSGEPSPTKPPPTEPGAP